MSSLQLSEKLEITQKSAWFLLQRIRKACEDDNNPSIDLLRGIAEADETYIGGKEKNKHASQKRRERRAGRPAPKIPVFGIRQRNGSLKAQVLPDTTRSTIQAAVRAALQPGSILCTDEHPAYKGMPEYYHHHVSHSAKQYVDGPYHTNGIESVWAVLKRSYVGIHHWFSPKHMQLYINELSFRFKSGARKIPIAQRMNSLIAMCFGKRLTYAQLIA